MCFLNCPLHLRRITIVVLVKNVTFDKCLFQRIQAELRRSKSPSPHRRSPGGNYHHPHGDSSRSESSSRHESNTSKDSRDSRDRSRSPISKDRDSRAQSPPRPSSRRRSPAPPPHAPPTNSHSHHQPPPRSSPTTPHMLHQEPPRTTAHSDMHPHHHIPASSGHMGDDKIVLEMDVHEAGDSDDGRDSPIDIMGYGDSKDLKDGNASRSKYYVISYVLKGVSSFQAKLTTKNRREGSKYNITVKFPYFLLGVASVKVL